MSAKVKKMSKSLEELKTAVANVNLKQRSAWGRGVGVYCEELIETCEEWERKNDEEIPNTRKKLEEVCLNGAYDWSEYSWGGCSFCYNIDIARNLCTPSELKRTREGIRTPNAREDWFDVQARALRQAFDRIWTAWHFAL